MTAEQIIDLADDLGITPSEVEGAISLIRSGRADLIAAVVDKRQGV